MIISDYKNLSWFIKDFTSSYHLKNFYNLINDQISVTNKVADQYLNINEHFLFYNRLSKELAPDGYYKDISPEQLMRKFQSQTFRRRMWARGSIEQMEPLQINKEYTCLEHVKNIRSYRSDVFVSLKRDIVDTERQTKLLSEIRTLIYTNSKPKPNNTIKQKIGNFEKDVIIGKFTFNEMDVVRYSQLTLNPHRIHWDHSYVRNHEHYKDILVQGPFSTQILTLFAEKYMNQSITKLNYRNVNYIYPGTTVDICLNINDIDDTYQFYMRDVSHPEKVYVFLQVESQSS
ncbi:hypothetical protein C6P45_004193 [Maudiozyma exigua]|uniref:MaoC-like domain-containing protein n=1 Tax=Maudiozyma exigua TaxID=34358 RepID=A0A9P7BBU0_MAUEX|nr:hypothetical protein C6P45_004193 [Kazachstania exigua]